MKKQAQTASKVISFRVPLTVYEVLQKLAKGKTDEMGKPLNPSVVARRLMFAAIGAGLADSKKRDKAS